MDYKLKIMSKLFKHLKTIRLHRKYVRQMCWKMGLLCQGLFHDLSKYSIPELKMYKYWTGKGSPHQSYREVLGYSPSWIHHYHRNKHHFQFWWDEDEDGKIIPIKMPYKYVIESFCDMVGACKAYTGNSYNSSWVRKYWEERCLGKRLMNKESEGFLDFLITTFDTPDPYYTGLPEKNFFGWYRENKKDLEKRYNEGLWKSN